MTYGAEILNSSGDTVFNTEDPTYEVISKGTASLPRQLSSAIYETIWTDPNFSSYSVQNGYYGFRNPSAVSNWPDGALIFYEILAGQTLYKLQNVTYTGGTVTTRAENLVSWNTVDGTKTFRYVIVRPTSYLTPSSGYGMEFYNSAGEVTWSSQKPVLSNVKPLSQTSTTNRWFSWSGDYTFSQGQYCGLYLYKGLRVNSSGFIKQSTTFGSFLPSRDTRMCGLPAGSQAIRGLSADIDWDEV